GSRKEVFQPHLPVRLPCYDLAPITGFTLTRSLRLHALGTPSFHGLTGGVYKARERIHRIIADRRLLANPTSRGRVADPDPNCEWLFEIGITFLCSCLLRCLLEHVCSSGRMGHDELYSSSPSSLLAQAVCLESPP